MPAPPRERLPSYGAADISPRMTQHRSSRACLLSIVACLAAIATHAAAQAPRAPLLDPLFRDHAVLQRDRPVAIRGSAAPGQTVTVRLAGGRVAATADPEFTIDTLPSILGTASFLRPLSADCQSCTVQSVDVVTSSATVFGSGLVNVSSLAVNNIVEVRGLLIKSGFIGPGPTSGFLPALVATQVRLQP